MCIYILQDYALAIVDKGIVPFATGDEGVDFKIGEKYTLCDTYQSKVLCFSLRYDVHCLHMYSKQI